MIAYLEPNNIWRINDYMEEVNTIEDLYVVCPDLFLRYTEENFVLAFNDECISDLGMLIYIK